MNQVVTDPDIIAQFEAQEKTLRQPRVVTDPNIVEKFEEQERLRAGDDPLTTIPGLAQGVAGIAETVAQMGVGFAAAVPGAVAGVAEELLQQSGVGAMIGREKRGYADTFADVTSAFTWEPKTFKGKRILEGVDSLYQEYMEDGLSEHLRDKVRAGEMTPAQAARFRTYGEALLLITPFRLFGKHGYISGGVRALRGKKPTSKTATKNEWVDIDAEPLEGEYIPGKGPRPQEPPGGAGATYEGEIYGGGTRAEMIASDTATAKPFQLPRVPLEGELVDGQMSPRPARAALERPFIEGEVRREAITEQKKLPVFSEAESVQVKALMKEGAPPEYIARAVEHLAKKPADVAKVLPIIREAWDRPYADFQRFVADFISPEEPIAQVLKRVKPPTREEAFVELADLQRGAPEKAMLDVHKASGGGVIGIVEHVGDLTHRMSEKPDFFARSRGHEYVKEKVDKSLRVLENKYGFAKEFNENLQANARYTGKAISRIRADVDKALAKYADEHRKLPVYNRPQQLARDAAVAMGEKRWADATANLKELGNLLDDPKEYARQASEFDLSFERPSRITNPNYQGGAIDFEVFAEGIKKLMQPGVRGTNAALQLAHELGRQFLFRHSSDIRRMPSPTAKILADKISPERGPIKEGFIQKLTMARGEFNTELELIAGPLRTHSVQLKQMRLITIPGKVNDALVTALNTGKLNPAYAHLQPQAKQIRALLDAIREYAIEAGVEMGEIVNYFPHVYNAAKIHKAEPYFMDRPLKKRGGEFTKYLMEEEKLSYDAAQRVILEVLKEDGWLEGRATEITNRFREGVEYSDWNPRATGYPGSEARPSPTRARKLTRGEWSKKKDWLVNDLESILHTYIRVMTERAEYVRLAGPKEVKLNQMVKQIIDENMALDYQLAPHQTARRIYDVFDALQHRFKYIEHRGIRRLNANIGAYEIMAHMSRVALAQVPETFTPSVKYRMAPKTKSGIPVPFKSHLVAVAAAFQDGMSAMDVVVTGKRHIPKSELKQTLDRLGISFVDALEASAARFGEGHNVGATTHRFMKLTGMEVITDFQRRVAADTVVSMVRSNAKALAEDSVQGRRKRMYEREFDELGIDKGAAIEWYKKGMPSESEFSRQLDNALVRGVNESIIMPDPSNVPVRFNDPRFTLPLQFTRFFTTFGNTFLRKVIEDFKSKDVTLDRKAASALGITALMAGAAYFTTLLNEQITGYSVREENDPMRIPDAADRAGLFGVFTRFYPLMAGEYKYKVGENYLINILGGPVGTDLAKLLNALKSGNTKQRARTLASLTPIANSNQYTKDELIEIYEDMLDQFDL